MHAFLLCALDLQILSDIQDIFHLELDLQYQAVQYTLYACNDYKWFQCNSSVLLEEQCRSLLVFLPTESLKERP